MEVTPYEGKAPIPADSETEQQVLGPLLDPAGSHAEEVLEEVSVEDFYYSVHQDIFRACQYVAEAAGEIDITQVRARLKDQGRLAE